MELKMRTCCMPIAGFSRVQSALVMKRNAAERAKYGQTDDSSDPIRPLIAYRDAWTSTSLIG